MDLSDDLLSIAELTTREREILELTALGNSAKQIAQEVEIAPRTVERHLENVRHKLRARNKSHMIAKAVALGVLHVDCSKARGAHCEEPTYEPPRQLVAND